MRGGGYRPIRGPRIRNDRSAPGGDVPVAEVDLILHVGGGLDIPLAIGKLKLLLGIRIELRRIGDDVMQGFVAGVKKDIYAGFQLWRPLCPEVSAGVAFAVAARLRPLRE